jgi:hypothetical protein
MLLETALQNLTTPPVLFFLLGAAAALARSDLTVPEAAAKLLSIYLLTSIGFRGGAEIAHFGLDTRLLLTVAIGALLSFLLPFAAFALLQWIGRLNRIDRAAVSAHYGSISIVTFIAATGILNARSIPFEGYMVGVAAAMEAPAIVAGLMLAAQKDHRSGPRSEVLRHVFLNGSIVVLLGALAIGLISGQKGYAIVKPLFVDPFQGILCLFLLDMGLLVGRGLFEGRRYLTSALAAFAVIFPVFGAGVAAVLAYATVMSAGSAALLMTLTASASYIAVPAALRLALPTSNPAIGLTLSLGVTFPFNLIVGIPVYIAIANWIGR